ncbi:hypothetical protein EGR_06899 [Echinococcus granulosus]|uniref:Uncharacterized protein n=1 Tax=Echinococcus granulosus TaxID=6210 RepID=W6UXI0_ECHGR|nr:hypothetical protein EGR_06899 [Echinococcus granulosus]EUB58264.1 hypothetical protein EGR_06899 [Echinococcus granulosus]
MPAGSVTAATRASAEHHVSEASSLLYASSEKENVGCTGGGFKVEIC